MSGCVSKSEGYGSFFQFLASSELNEQEDVIQNGCEIYCYTLYE